MVSKIILTASQFALCLTINETSGLTFLLLFRLSLSSLRLADSFSLVTSMKVCDNFFMLEHREHTILLSRKRANKAMKRINIVYLCLAIS